MVSNLTVLGILFVSLMMSFLQLTNWYREGERLSCWKFVRPDSNRSICTSQLTHMRLHYCECAAADKT